MDEATDGHTDALAAVATGATHHHHHFGLDHAHHLDEAGDASRKHQEEVRARLILQHAAAPFQTLLCLALFAATAQRIITYWTNAMFVGGRVE